MHVQKTGPVAYPELWLLGSQPTKWQPWYSRNQLKSKASQLIMLASGSEDMHTRASFDSWSCVNNSGLTFNQAKAKTRDRSG